MKGMNSSQQSLWTSRESCLMFGHEEHHHDPIHHPLAPHLQQLLLNLAHHLLPLMGSCGGVPVPIAGTWQQTLKRSVVAMTVRGASAAVHMETVFGGGTLACKSWVHCTDRSRWPRHWQMYRHAAYRQYILFDQSTISWYLWPHDNVKKYVCVSYFNFQE